MAEKKESKMVGRTSGTKSIAEKLVAKIESRRFTAAVVGLGYVGLPLAMELCEAGVTVIGLDVDERKVRALSAGSSYIDDIPSATVAAAIASGRFVPTTDFSQVAKADTVDICVPTPLRKTKDPDLSYVVAASEAISRHLKKGMLVVLESTTYPGTTDEVLAPLVEGSGFVVGRDVFLAFSPERVDPGNARFTTKNIPKVVGGVTAECTRVATAFYKTCLETVHAVSSARVAEMVKLLENTFRSVNIALVNEMAMMCDRMGITVWEVIDAAKTKPFGFMPFYPGPGIGGHCIPLDPFYLSWKAKQFGFESRFIELAGVVNGAMPHHVVSKVVDALNMKKKSVNGAKVLLLGVAYKKNIADVRESPALDIMKLLADKGATVSFCDPHVSEIKEHGVRLASSPFSVATLKRADCVVVITDHDDFDYSLVAKNSVSVVDTRNALKGKGGAKVLTL